MVGKMGKVRYSFIQVSGLIICHAIGMLLRLKLIWETINISTATKVELYKSLDCVVLNLNSDRIHTEEATTIWDGFSSVNLEDIIPRTQDR